eukprot:TRINITY_DN34090_c0_g1_i1.p1 TRINITY_DN34090_c0_g1~~TRINITY_DN34090_c0_g1_i1.p1  ORF type:complete len:397 (+),score=76.24 TRINITY_DN34090_c0_g1_i1:37-1191(+)
MEGGPDPASGLRPRLVPSRMLLAGLILRWQPSRAWGVEGHDRINEVADHILNPRERHKVNALLKTDLSSLADWEQMMARTYPGTELLQWHDQTPEWSCKSVLDDDSYLRCDSPAPRSGSLFCALAYFLEHFVHGALKQYKHPKRPVNVPQELSALSGLPAQQLATSHHLRWLVTLIGDLHQPLHWLRPHNYGRDILLEFDGKEYTLLNFWEDYLPKHISSLPQLSLLSKHFQREKTSWQFKRMAPVELFREWSKDVSGAFCQHVLKPIEESAANDASRAFYLDQEQRDKWLNMTEEIVIRAGERLAFILLDLLHHHKDKMGHREGRGHWNGPQSILEPTNFMKNIGIAVVVLPILVAALEWHYDRGRSPWLFGLFGRRSEHLKN